MKYCVFQSESYCGECSWQHQFFANYEDALNYYNQMITDAKDWWKTKQHLDIKTEECDNLFELYADMDFSNFHTHIELINII